MEDTTREFVYTDDGRKAEKITKTVAPMRSEDCNKTKITEIFVEPKVEKKLSQRIVEHTKPFIHKKEIEIIDEETGEVLETKVESIEPEPRMELRNHTIYTDSLTAQSAKDNDGDCTLTMNDLKELLQEVVSEKDNSYKKRRTRKPKKAYNYYENYEEDDGNEDVSVYQQAVGQRVEQSTDQVSLMTVFLGAVILVQVAVLAYILLIL